MIGPLAAEAMGRQLMQLVVNQRHQLIERCLATAAPLPQELRHGLWLWRHPAPPFP